MQIQKKNRFLDFVDFERRTLVFLMGKRKDLQLSSKSIHCFVEATILGHQASFPLWQPLMQQAIFKQPSNLSALQKNISKQERQNSVTNHPNKILEQHIIFFSPSWHTSTCLTQYTYQQSFLAKIHFYDHTFIQTFYTINSNWTCHRNFLTSMFSLKFLQNSVKYVEQAGIYC